MTKVSPHINIIEFFGAQVLPELQSAGQDNLILKADCLKFVALFRNQVRAPPAKAMQNGILMRAGVRVLRSCRWRRTASSFRSW